jgi:hypothetical protein
MTTQVPAVIQASARDLGQMARRYLSGWRGVIVLVILALTAGLALGWSWLVAAGIAPILISVLPCLAMCALGLCMHRGGGRSCSAEDTTAKTIDTPVETAPPPKTLALQSDSPVSVATDEQANTVEQRRMTHA